MQMSKKYRSRLGSKKANANLIAFNDFNLLLLGTTAAIGFVWILLKLLGYDMSAFI